MNLEETLQEILDQGVPAAFEQFGQVLDGQWVEEALLETGSASIRRRKLPAELLIWLVIGMALFRDRCIQEVAAHLQLALPGKKGEPSRNTVVPSAIPQARERLGWEPIEAIFHRTGEAWAEPGGREHAWHGLLLYGTDGTTLRVPDSEENEAEFGRPGTGRGQSGYPQVRLVTLMALSTHILRGAAFGPCTGQGNGEVSLAKKLWGQVPDHSLSIIDRGFLSYGLFWHLQQSGEARHWLVRTKKNLKWTVLEELGEGDYRVQLKLSKESRAKDPSLPETMECRAIQYQLDGGDQQVLFTSLLDIAHFPAEDVIKVYHERWEIELGYGEIKTQMLERKEALRSRKAYGVRQEIWGILLAYNLVRFKMLRLAKHAGVEPKRISFTHSLRLIRLFCITTAWTSSPSNLPKRLPDLDDMLPLLILPERRPDRRYPRHVKIKMSGYKRNKGRTPKPTKRKGKKLN